ncbi:VanW family protein [Syntrophomonas curvata]
MIQVKWKSIIIYVLVLLLGISAALVLYFYQVFYKSHHFLPGVRIATINVGGYDQNGAADLLAAEFDYLSDTGISFNYRDYQYDTRLGDLVDSPDPRKIIVDVWEQERHRNLFSKVFNLDGAEAIEYPVKITYDAQKLKNMGSDWKEHLESECLNARLEIDPVKGLVVIPAKKGIQVDIQPTLAALPGEWQPAENINIKIAVQEIEPRIKESDLHGMGEISSFSTWYNPSQTDRSHNVALATRALNTTMVAAGEVFSFNKTVGPRLPEGGYRDAMVIVGDKFEQGLAGGICQVSSTLYNACLLAGLKITERHNHNLAVAYVPLGQDATVSYGTQDFCFQNNLGDPIYIWSQAGNGKVTMRIYGKLKYKQSIQVSHIVDQVIDFKEIRETKEDLPPGTTKIEQNGSPGYVVRSFRTFFGNDGNIVRQEQLARDNYRPLNRLVYVGPAESSQPGGEPPETEDPTHTSPEENEGGNAAEDGSDVELRG